MHERQPCNRVTPHRFGTQVIALLAMCLAAISASAANELVDVRSHDGPESTRVVLDTKAQVEYRTFVLDRPDRVVFDLMGVRAAQSFKPPAVTSDVVRRIRAAVNRPGVLRVVIDLERKVAVNHFRLEPVGPYGHRLVIDLEPDAPVRRPLRAPVVSPPEGQRDIMVAIDAGHGGEDPGAIGVGGIYEKRVVLSIAQEIKQRLDAARGFAGVLTRKGDYGLPLRKRTEIARQVPADIFVSIHADAFKNNRARGASVYALSQRGASSETARWLAESENRADLIGGFGPVTLEGRSNDLQEVLVDMSMKANLGRSLELGEAIRREMAAVARMHKKRVEQAGFAVLKSPDVPSVLVETGFISNAGEARLLASAAHQRKLGEAIALGIQNWAYADPPAGTMVATIAGEMLRHTVQSGETISHIAERYSVTVRDIRGANNVPGDRIYIGQLLLIPRTAAGG